MTEVIAVFLTASAIFGPIIFYACWYSMRQERQVASLKPASSAVCVPSRSQMTRQAGANAANPERRIVDTPSQPIQINISINIEKLFQNFAPKKTPMAHTSWQVINPQKIEQHRQPNQLPEQSSAASITHSLFKARSRQDA